MPGIGRELKARHLECYNNATSLDWHAGAYIIPELLSLFGTYLLTFSFAILGGTFQKGQYLDGPIPYQQLHRRWIIENNQAVHAFLRLKSE